MKYLARIIRCNSIQSNDLLTFVLLLLTSVFVFSNCCLAEPQEGEIKIVSSGSYHTCTVRTDNGLYCWGKNDNGQLGDGTTTQRTSPPSSPVLTDVKKVSLGYQHTCAIKTDGGLYCWGDNEYGQLGDETNTSKNTPPPSPVLTDVKEVSSGSNHTCAIKTDGGLYCWGRNHYGQLGDGTTTGKNTPPLSPVLTEVKEVSLGAYCTCAVKTDGGLYCWGYNGYGQLGNGASSGYKKSPPLSPVLTEVKEVSLGIEHTCAVKTDGGLYCWGLNDYGQLGDGTNTNDRNTPPLSPVLTDVKDVSLGDTHTCAVKTDGGLYCWGRNSSGQLGDGTTAGKLSPPLGPVLTDVKGVSLNGYYTCAVKTDSGLYCWGSNVFGQLGDGTTSTRITPQAIFSGGCTADTDGDGTPDCNDECIDDPDKQEAGGCGCGTADTDTDGDGTPDCNDECVTDPDKQKVGVCGCGTADTDTDSDGTLDCNDECVTDPNKTEAGVCGCGKEEVPGCGVIACSSDPLYSEIGNSCDTGNLGECKVGVYICKDDAVTCNQQKEASAEICGDNKDNDCDGEVDEGCIVDLCPEDPNKTKPGICGCGVKDIDSDSDGIFDCNDECPVNPNKTEPGICGCNIQDIDSDGDGVPDCLDGCPNDPKNKDLNPPEEGCFVENSEVPEKYDPKVEVDPTRIVTPKEKLLPVYVVKKKAKAVIYLERFSGAAFKKLENLMALFEIQKATKKTTYRHEVRIAARNKKTGNRTTNTKKLKSNKTSFKLKLAKNTIYTIKYRIIIKQGKKEKATKWSKAVKVKQ